jgi:hemin uptake protein HemP
MPITHKNEGQAESGMTQSTSPTPRMISVVGHKVDSREIFIGTREVVIHHGSDIYRLRLTAQNKLILTK